MTEKRYYAHKHLLQENKVHDKICHKFMNISETVEHMNMYYQKYTALKKENEQLKQEIAKFKEWEKHIGGVKRDDLDRVFKMSIYEIAEAFEYYRKKIKELSE